MAASGNNNAPAFTEAETAAVRRHLLTLYSSARRNFTREEELPPGEQIPAAEYPRVHHELAMFYSDTLNGLMADLSNGAHVVPVPHGDGSCHLRLLLAQNATSPNIEQLSEALANLDLNAPGPHGFAPLSAVYNLQHDASLRAKMTEPFLAPIWKQKVGSAVDRARKAWGSDAGIV